MYPKCLRYLLVFCNILSEYGLYRHVNKLYTPKSDGLDIFWLIGEHCGSHVAMQMLNPLIFCWEQIGWYYNAIWNTYSHIYHNLLALENYFQNLMARHVQFYNAPKKSIFRNHIGNLKKQVTKLIKNHTKYVHHKH